LLPAFDPFLKTLSFGHHRSVVASVLIFRWQHVPLYQAEGTMYASGVAAFRYLLTFSQALMLAIAPLLACLPSPAMTDAEMACCKKMAGNCDMGSGDHSCCKTTLNRVPASAAFPNHQVLHVDFVLVPVSVVPADVAPDRSFADSAFTYICLASSPPGFQSILRI
jgi:hypothetical protein